MPGQSAHPAPLALSVRAGLLTQDDDIRATLKEGRGQKKVQGKFAGRLFSLKIPPLDPSRMGEQLDMSQPHGDPEGLEPVGTQGSWVDDYNRVMTEWYRKNPHGRPPIEFDHGKTATECIENCKKKFQLLPDGLDSAFQIGLASGLPIPKPVAGALGLRVVGVGGANVSKFTTLPSILSQQIYKVTGTRVPALRTLGRGANAALPLYLLSEMLVHTICLEECNQPTCNDDWKRANSATDSSGRVWSRNGGI
jgi:hypothetical protein